MPKKTKLKIGIVGCGAIGSSLAKAITRDFKDKAKLAALFDINAKRSEGLSRSVYNTTALATASLGQLINKSELVIEAASAASSWEIARKALSQGKDIMVMSVGGIVANFAKLRRQAEKKNCRVHIPSGAISGVDALKAAGREKIKRVILTTRKNPLSFKGVEYLEKKGMRLDKIKKDTLLFSGTARQAVRFFPQNINVAGILSIAGIGENKTKVRIIASPALKKNIHEIEIDAKAAKVFTRTENILHPDNPKTSYLAVLSAIATLQGILQPVRIGT